MAAPKDIAELIAALTGPGGCPWDKAQTCRSLRHGLLGEVHEVVHAIDAGDDDALEEELGDLLFLVHLLIDRATAEGRTRLPAIRDRVIDKMVGRHPHVFGDATEPPDWHALKRAEKPERSSALDGLPPTLPPLQTAWELGRRASAEGFDWPDVGGVFDKIDEELQELREAHASGDHIHAEEEMGDVLFSVVNLARHLDIQPHLALPRTNRKFASRYRRVEAMCLAEGGTVRTTDAATLDRMWNQVKESS